MKRKDLEGPIHRSIIHYLRSTLPPSAIIHHSPNEGVRGGARGKLDGIKRKAMGVQAGFPDILIFSDGKGYCLEVKAEGGRLSPLQKIVKQNLEEQGIPYAVVRSIQDVRESLAEWGVRSKEARVA